jgi:multiple sugar transport system substrate-binding protein
LTLAFDVHGSTFGEEIAQATTGPARRNPTTTTGRTLPGGRVENENGGELTMARRSSRSLVLLLALAIAALGPLAAARAQDGTPVVDESLSGTVTYWTAYNTVSPEFKALTEEVIPAFNARYPNVKIDAQAIPYDDLRQKLLTGIAGGQTPDLLRADIIWVPEFAELGALAKIDELIPDFATYKDRFYPGPLATNFYQGNYYGLPLDTNTRIVFYDKPVFEAAGITAAPATFEEVAAACAKIKALGKPDTYCFAEGGTGAWNVLPWIWSAGGAVTDPEYTTATGYLNGAGSVAAVTLLRDMLNDGTLSPSILGGGIATSDAIGKDQVGFIVDGPWMPPIFEAQYPDLQYDLAPFPAGPGGSISVVGGENIVLFEQSKVKDAALAFMRFVLEEEPQIAMGKTGQMPVLQSLTGNSELPAYFATFQEQLATAQPRTPSPAWPKIDDAINTAVQQVLRGEKEPQAALDEAAAAVDELLKKK